MTEAEFRDPDFSVTSSVAGNVDFTLSGSFPLDTSKPPLEKYMFMEGDFTIKNLDAGHELNLSLYSMVKCSYKPMRPMKR